MRTEYRIIGRFANTTEFHVVDYNKRWTKEDAEIRLKELIRLQELEKQQGESHVTIGKIGISTPYYPEYELKDLRIQSREVSKWS